ncbi:MAG: zinc-ribbon domain-containing protein [Clostridiales bacterium]|nr:zinc-ribbon domain-containing protein [Clostridiales bacterium]
MYCGQCGKKNKESAMFCEYCGAKLEVSGRSAENTAGAAPDPVRVNYKQAPPGGMKFDENNIPEEYRPITMWGYFGYEILFAIPIVGWILVIVFSITAKNHNLKNFARSHFCILIIALVILLIVVAVAGVGFMSMGRRW